MGLKTRFPFCCPSQNSQQIFTLKQKEKHKNNEKNGLNDETRKNANHEIKKYNKRPNIDGNSFYEWGKKLTRMSQLMLFQPKR